MYQISFHQIFHFFEKSVPSFFSRQYRLKIIYTFDQNAKFILENSFHQIFHFFEKVCQISFHQIFHFLKKVCQVVLSRQSNLLVVIRLLKSWIFLKLYQNLKIAWKSFILLTKMLSSSWKIVFTKFFIFLKKCAKLVFTKFFIFWKKCAKLFCPDKVTCS